MSVPARGAGSTLVCAGCGASPPAADPYPFRCPNADADADDVDHVLRRRLDLSAVAFPTTGPEDMLADANPYLRFRRLFHAWHVAVAGGMSDEAYCELVRGLDDAVASVDGRGFVATPFRRAGALSDLIGFTPDGGVWIKDETDNVSGSHKARHLFGLLVYLEVVDRLGLASADDSCRLAIASCGNAALAAAVVAAAGRRTLDVFVPVDADESVVARLTQFGAHVTACPRQPGVVGDPAYHRLRAALADGSLPFTCQGNQNGLAVEGAFTLGYEMTEALAGEHLDHVIVQVGGGALASACIESLDECRDLGVLAATPRYHAVQTRGAWPLARAFERLVDRLSPGASDDERRSTLRYAATHRSEFMWPWEEEPRSIAHGILDDETYDWLAVVEGMLESGGGPVVVGEDILTRANRLAFETTGIDVDETGSAGLAGLVALRERGEIGDDECVAVLFTGRRRR